MGKKSFTVTEVEKYDGRPNFYDSTKVEMETRWTSQSGIYKPQLVNVNGEPQLHVICQACGCLGQAATMHIGHITTWKQHVKNAMIQRNITEISTTDLIAVFNDPQNLRWEHSACNISHAFELGDPFAANLDPTEKVQMLLKVTSIAEGGFTHQQIAAMTPKEFLAHENNKFVPAQGEGGSVSSKLMTDEDIHTAKTPPRIHNDVAKPIDIATLNRKQLPWFDETRKALYLGWKSAGLVVDVDNMAYLKCGSCQKFSEGSSMHLGHKTVWKKHLENKRVQNLAEAKIAYNDLNNLRFECSNCNCSHDWEDLTLDEQDALDNALFRVAEFSGIMDESALMRTLVFGDLKNLPDDLVIDGDLMRRVAVFAQNERLMAALPEMANAEAQVLDAEARAANLRGQLWVDASLAQEALDHALTAEDTARRAIEYVQNERKTLENEGARVEKELSAIMEQAAKEIAAGKNSQSDLDTAQYQLEQAKAFYEEKQIEISGHEHKATQLLSEAQNKRQTANQFEHTKLQTQVKFLNADTELNKRREKVARQREELEGPLVEVAAKATSDWDAEQQYMMLRGVLNPEQLDGFKLLQAALQVEAEEPYANSDEKKASVLRKVEIGLRYSKQDFNCPQFRDADARRALVDTACTFAHAKVANLNMNANPNLNIGNQSVKMDALYDNLVEIQNTGKPSDEVRRLFMEKLNAM